MALVRQINRLASRAVNHKGFVPMKAKPKPVEAIPPTPEQMAKAEFELIAERTGKYWMRVSPLDKLAMEKIEGKALLTERHISALTVYRDSAVAQFSELRDSLAKLMDATLSHGGSVEGFLGASWYATAMRDRCEASAGILAHILRAVIVQDIPLSTWAARVYGSKMDRQTVGDKVIEYRRPTAWAMQRARKDIHDAAEIVASVIGGQGPGRILDDRIAA